MVGGWKVVWNAISTWPACFFAQHNWTNFVQFSTVICKRSLLHFHFLVWTWASHHCYISIFWCEIERVSKEVAHHLLHLVLVDVLTTSIVTIWIHICMWSYLISSSSLIFLKSVTYIPFTSCSDKQCGVECGMVLVDFNWKITLYFSYLFYNNFNVYS